MKYLYLLFLLLLTNHVFAQKRLVLIEEFTNTGCNPCASWSPELDAVIENRLGDCIAIKYHSSYPNRNDEFYNYDPVTQQIRHDFYGVDGVPATYVNGEALYFRTSSYLDETITQQMAQPQRYSLTLSKEIEDHKMSVHATITPLQDIESGTSLRLFVAAIEEHITPSKPYPNGETALHYTMRKMFTGGDGYQISDGRLYSGQDYVYSASWSIGLVMRNGMFGYDDTQISYWLEGDDVLCIQYKNVGLQTASYMTDKKDVAKATIEYRLYQKSGNIEMKLSGFKPYDDADVGNSNFMRIGILGDTGDFIQIQSYDGSVISARDNSISYDAENYPADGTVYTFVAPEPCQTPATAPSNLVINTTSTQISGSFTAGSSDHYLVLAATSEMTEAPADNQKYAVGDEIGGAKVIAVVEGTEFVGPDNMEPNQSYNVYVYGFNSLCSAGPLYNSTPATATMVTKPGAPESLSFSNVEKNALSVSVTANGSAPVLVAMTSQQAQGQWGEYIDAGTFGVPTGNYNVGDEIEGGGKVIFIGNPGEAIQVDGLQVGTPYFFRAWSGDGNGGYSSEFAEGTEVTVAELPWSMSIDEKVGYEATMPGWTFNDPEEWNSDPDEGHIYHRMSYIDETGSGVAWMESPFISMAEGANRIKTAISATAGGGWMSGDWTLGDNDKIVFQLTKDGVEYKDVFTIDKDNAGTLLKGGYTPFTGAFEEMAGETVRLRISIHRSIAGETRFNKLLIEQKPDLEEPVNLAATDIVGGTVTLEWTPQGDETEWEIEYKTAEEESWGEAVVVSEPKITIEDLLGLTQYEARVRAIKDGKQSAWSDVAAFTTGFSVPFDFILQGAKNMDGWKTYTGQLGETTTLEEGGDIVIRTSGWGVVMYRTLFNPMGNSTASWLVSPKFAVGDDASRQFIANLSLLTQFVGEDCNLTVKVVVAKDGENFSSDDVIGTITNDQLPTSDAEPVDFAFPFSGYTGNIRLGFYFEGTGNDMSWYELYRVAVLEDLSSIQSVKADNGDDKIYNLQGVQLNNPQRGINIVNGKKMVVK